MSWHTKDWLKLLSGLVVGAAATPLLGSAAGALGLGGSGAGAATGTASKGVGSMLTGLLKDTAKQTAGGVVSGVAMNALTPQYGMTTPSNVPQLQQDDPMVAIQQLMERSKHGRTY